MGTPRTRQADGTARESGIQWTQTARLTTALSCFSLLFLFPSPSTSVSKSPLSILSASDFQVPLWVDRVRLPEFFFQPTALLGLDEAGLSEMIRRALVRLPTEHATRVAKHIFVCGGSTQFPNFLTRIENEVRQIRPTDSELRVAHARHPQWDAWRGAARMCNR